MSKKEMNKPLAAAIGAALAGTLSAGSALAAENPFGLQPLESGYMQLAAAHMEGKCGGEKSESEGKCGEGKCGGEKSASEGKCGGEKSESEGKCGEGKCGGEKSASEGKCGEGKCGEAK
jgi:uncharacterized low-complexity protein